MKFFYVSKAFIVLAFLQFNISLGINLSVIKNFCTDPSLCLNFNLWKSFNYTSLSRSYELAHKHQTAVLGTLGLVTLGITTFICLQNFFKKNIPQLDKKENPKSIFEEFIENERLSPTRHHYISPNQYFILSEQISRDYPCGITLCDSNGEIIERIVINDKTVFDYYIECYKKYNNL